MLVGMVRVRFRDRVFGSVQVWVSGLVIHA